MPDSWAKAFRPDDGLVVLDRVAGQAADQAAGAGQLLGLHADLDAGELVGPDLDGHDHLLQGGVAGPLPQPVDAHLDLAGAGLHAGQRVGRGQPQVVVAVGRGDVVALDLAADVLDQGAEVPRDAVADGVGDVQRGGAGVDRGLQHLEHEVQRGAGGVLGAELDVAGVLGGPGHAAAGGGQHLGPVHLQHVLHVLGAGGDEDVDAGPLGVAQGVPAPVDVGHLGAGQAGDDRARARCGRWCGRPRSRPRWRRGTRPRCSRPPGGPAARRSPASRPRRGRCRATARRRAAWCRR